MGFYTRFTDPAAREEIVRYYQFLKRYDDLYRANRSHAEAVLLYPRKAVHEGDVAAVAKFKEVGKKLLDDHVLFDVLPDDLPGDPLERRPGGPPVSPRLLVQPRAKSPLAVLPKDRSTFTAPRNGARLGQPAGEGPAQ